MASSQVYEMVGAPVARLYHPLGAGEAGLRAGVTVGRVASRLKDTAANRVPPRLVASQVSVVPAVSAETVDG